MFNNKGQAASTFQLLIAAIVAMAILGVLMGVLGGLAWEVTKDPEEGAESVLKEAVKDPFSIKGPEEVLFDRDHSIIDVTALTARADIPLVPTEVCITEGDQTGAFSTDNGKVLNYNFGGTKSVKVKAVCVEEGDQFYSLGAFIDSHGQNEPVHNCETESPGSGTFCVVYLVR